MTKPKLFSDMHRVRCNKHKLHQEKFQSDINDGGALLKQVPIKGLNNPIVSCLISWEGEEGGV